MEFFYELPQFVKYSTFVFASIIAMLGLIIEREKWYFKYVAPVFIVLVIFLCIFQIAGSINSDKDNTEAKQQRENLLSLVDNVSYSSARTSTYLTDILLSQPKILKDFGLT
jgi:amino acid permease